MQPMRKKRVLRPYALLLVGLAGLMAAQAAAIALPPSSHLKTLLHNIPALNEALQEDPDLLSNTRLTDITLDGVVLKNGTITNTRWRNVRLLNPHFTEVTVADSNWFGVKVRDMAFKNVTFDDLSTAIDTTMDWRESGNSSFFTGVMDNVHFINSVLQATHIGNLKHSRITFTNSKMSNDTGSESDSAYTHMKGWISDSQLTLRMIHSSMEVGPMSLSYPSEIYLEKDSAIKTMGVSGELKRLEVRDSYFAGRVGDRADYVYMENSQVGVGLSQVHLAHLVNNRYLHTKRSPRPVLGGGGSCKLSW